MSTTVPQPARPALLIVAGADALLALAGMALGLQDGRAWDGTCDTTKEGAQ